MLRALPMIDRGGYPSGNRPVAAISVACLPGAGYGQFEHKADSLIATSKGGMPERLMYEQSHRDYLRSGYLHHRLPVMGR